MERGRDGQQQLGAAAHVRGREGGGKRESQVERESCGREREGRGWVRGERRKEGK